MERVERVCDRLLVFKMNEKETVLEKPILEKVQIPSPLRESFIIFVFIVANLITNLWELGDYGLILRLIFVFGTFLFGGWVKKYADIKINAVIEKLGLRDNEIRVLKDIKVKLESEIEKLTDRLTNMSVGNVPSFINTALDNTKDVLRNEIEKKIDNSDLSIS